MLVTAYCIFSAFFVPNNLYPFFYPLKWMDCSFKTILVPVNVPTVFSHFSGSIIPLKTFHSSASEILSFFLYHGFLVIIINRIRIMPAPTLSAFGQSKE